ncbi:MAG: sulfide/dihydroorotate dehydrogenase-like FAD/NAD-binding protein [Bacteroidales bacterium]|nr:sulfide/dihydroorotate dehydrogenase-like FAD/NAD-binding protein [Bacteroidales bacterium]
MQIVDRTEIAPNVHVCTVSAAGIAAKVQPGQFIIVIPDQYSERTPITVADWDIDAGTITFIFLDIGSSTNSLAQMNAGDEIYSLTGPLGKSFELKEYGTVCLVGGCYGIGGIFPAARALRDKGNRVVCYSEARSKFLLYWNEKLEEVSDEVRYATADGSLGHKGHAFDLLEKDLQDGTGYDVVFAVGCTFMMYRISQVTRPHGLKTIVSMNPIMIDGTGMCGACRIEVDGATRFACVDGPHFDGHKVDWDVILTRRKAYLEEEIISGERHDHGKS